MANGDDSTIHLLHTLWSLILSALGGLMWWNWKNLNQRIDTKAEREDMDRRLRETQSTLERIEEAIIRNEGIAATRRHEMANSLQELVGTVGSLKGYIEGRDRSKGG